MFSITPLCIQRVSRHSVLTVQHETVRISFRFRFRLITVNYIVILSVTFCICAMPNSSAFSNIRPSASYKHNVYHVIIRSVFSFLHSALNVYHIILLQLSCHVLNIYQVEECMSLACICCRDVVVATAEVMPIIAVFLFFDLFCVSQYFCKHIYVHASKASFLVLHIPTVFMEMSHKDFFSHQNK